MSDGDDNDDDGNDKMMMVMINECNDIKFIPIY